MTDRFLDPWLRRQLSQVHLALPPRRPEPPAPGRPLLLVANHTSWFDGFLLRRVQRRVAPEATLRTLMLSRELEGWRGGRPLLRQLGGTGFDPERPMTLRGALRTLDEARDAEGGLVVAFFPQGRIYPSFRQPLGFRAGLRLVMRTLAPITVVPVALHLEAGRRIRPTAWLLAGEGVPVEPDGIPDIRQVESLVARLCHRVHHHLSTWGEDAERRWPPEETPG